MASVDEWSRDKDIGSWAALEDVNEPEDRQVLVKVSRILGRGRGLVTING